VAAALALGAAGVWMGSCWLTTEEYVIGTAQPALREALLAAGSADTVRSRIASCGVAMLAAHARRQALPASL